MSWFNPLSWGRKDNQPMQARGSQTVVGPSVNQAPAPPVDNLKYLTENDAITKEIKERFWWITSHDLSLSQIEDIEERDRFIKRLEVELDNQQNNEFRVWVPGIEQVKEDTETRMYILLARLNLSRSIGAGYFKGLTSVTSTIESKSTQTPMSVSDKAQNIFFPTQ